MTKTIIKPANAAPALGPYNHGVRVGDLLFCAGQIPIDPAHPTGPLPADIKAQTERVLENIKIILDDQKLSFTNVVKSTVFMVNLGDFAAMNEVYARFFTADFPARSTVQVAALPRGGKCLPRIGCNSQGNRLTRIRFRPLASRPFREYAALHPDAKRRLTPPRGPRP